MANPEHLQILQQGVEAWNQWRDRNRDIKPDLVGANLGELAATGPIDKKYDFVLSSFDEINLTDANLTKANFGLASLPRSTFSGGYPRRS